MPLDPRDAARLDDILIYAKRAQTYIGDLTEDELRFDAKTQDAVARCFEIIGEAARQLSSECKTRHNLIPWPLIIGMRHRIVHEYSKVDYGLVLTTARNHLPTLIAQIQAVLAQDAP